MPTFCRHNRFIERCPICRQTLPGYEEPSAGAAAPRAGESSPGAPAARRAPSGRASRARGQSVGVRVRRELRAADDGYRSPLLPGLRASADAGRLAEEIAFSSRRLLALGEEPPGLYGDVRELAKRDLEQATWACFLIAYLSPLEGAEPFAGIRMALGSERDELIELEGIPLGPRTSHEAARGGETLNAYRAWAAQSGSQARAFLGDSGWSPSRRFERIFERLALPGLRRGARYELLLVLGPLAIYELEPDGLHAAGAGAGAAGDASTLAAKRVFGIGDTINLDRRAAALASALAVPVGALELALANWGSEQRATLGFSPEVSDAAALERARHALGL
jgi:hypothetical protein